MSANFEERSVNSELASRVRGAMTKTAVAVAFVGLAQTGMAGPANASPGVGGPLVPPISVGQFRTDAPTGPDDPLCIQMPTDPVCEDGPYWQGPPSPAPPGPPTGPLDPSCMSNPADAACVGSPYIPQPPPPSVEAPPPPIEAPPSPIEMPISPPPMAMPSAGMGGMPGSI
jgi:hypothetical protein